jgi:hypothetical protein
MNFTRRTTWIAAAGLVLTACATTPPPEYARDHPANPEAPAAAVQPASDTLANYRSFGGRSKQNADIPAAPPPEPPTTDSGHEHHH